MLDSLLNIVIAYVCVTGGPLTHDYAARFVATWLDYHPGTDCDLVVCCNGGPLPLETALLFEPLNAKFLVRENDPGWDITAYQDVCAKFEFDQVCACGESIHFHREGWLKRYVECRGHFGPGLYGTFSSFLVRPHLNTTGFFCDRQLLANSWRPHNRKERHLWEHGEIAFWRALKTMRYATKLVTFDGVYDPPQWRYPPNILWRGNQSNCLMRCGHSDRWDAADEKTKLAWSRGADGFGKTIPL